MKYLSHYTQQAQTELFNETGAFFAFSKKQVEEQRREGVKYTFYENLGLFVPSEHAEKLETGLIQIQIKAIKADVHENGAEAIIRREYFNYECQITCDTSDAKEQLIQYQEIFPKLFSDEKIKEVFKSCWEDAIEQYLF